MKLNHGNSIIKSVLAVSLSLSAPQINLLAENRLSLTRLSQDQIGIELANSDTIAGLQFSIHSGSAVVLATIQKSDLIENPNWDLQYNRTDDSTMMVVVLNMGGKGILPGSGTLVRLMLGLTRSGVADLSELSLAGAVLASPEGKGLQVTVSSTMAVNSQTPLLNYPNPFNPTTTIAYCLREPARVRLTIYDVIGREVRQLVDREEAPGEYNVTWDARNSDGHSVASGIYIYRLTVNGSPTTKKMQLQR
jgi:hypothetical protein